MEFVFLDGVAYALVTLVGADVGGSSIVGIYRMDGPQNSTVIADIGAFSEAHPPDTDYFVPTGVQYALETFDGGFLVTDGHHNRVLRVSLDGEIDVLQAFDNIVPTGLEVRGRTIYMAELGPAPNHPEDGKVVAFNSASPNLRRWAPVRRCSLTWSSPSVVLFTLWRRGSGTAWSRVRPRSLIPDRWSRSKEMARSPRLRAP